MMVCDESDEIKNPSALRTKALMKLKRYSAWRRIMTGTPIDGTPFSAYSQFMFLDERILGTTSYTAFKSEYAEMVEATDPIMIAVVKKVGPRGAFAQIVKKDPVTNQPKYRNLDKLAKLISTHSFRVKKEECLDLPPKVYKTAIFRLTPQQRKVYIRAEEELRLQYGEETTPFNRLAIATKLSQITSGYYLHPLAEGEPVRIEGENPKLNLLAERVAACVAAGHKVIVWARYKIEILDIVMRLREASIACVQYDGSTTREDRVTAIDLFERGGVPVFVGNQQAGGTGITLVAASVVMYFSNNFRLRDRLQSEDRAHRIGQTKTVTYYNLVGKGTIDEAVVKVLLRKEDVADCIVDPNFQLFATEEEL
jgi:SNF2 family DNA or RNA helicase